MHRPVGGCGERVSSLGKDMSQTVHIGGEAFDVNLYALPLGDNNMVLGVHWLITLGPVLWDLVRHTMAFVRLVKRIHWRDTDATPGFSAATLTSSGRELLDALLEEFASLFVEPQGLPPRRHLSHRIRLQEGVGPVVVRPYRYAHVPKDELERQCDQMLRVGVIQPSSSAFFFSGASHPQDPRHVALLCGLPHA